MYTPSRGNYRGWIFDPIDRTESYVFGDAWQYMLVAESAAGIAVDPRPSIWDLAALPVIIEEAGGPFSDLAGGRTLTDGARSPSTGSYTMRPWR